MALLGPQPMSALRPKCGAADLAPGEIDEYGPLVGHGRRPDLPDGRAVENPVQWASKKYFASRIGRNSFMDSCVPPKQRGVSRSSRTLGRDAVDAAAFCARRDRRAGDEPVSGP